MKIMDLKTTVVGTPWRELTFLELETDNGLVGLGEVRMVNKTDTLLACIHELAPRHVVGSDPFDVERLAWNIQVAEYGRPGEVAMSALAAFEVACWDLVGQSVNARLLTAGLVYPAFYATLPADLRTHLAAVSQTTRDAQPPSGLWPRSVADPNGPATVADLAGLEELVIWPKLFRHIVPYLASGFSDFDGFDAWLRADPVHRDDELFLLEKLERGNMHDVVRGIGHQIQLTVWPEDFIISPDPPAGAGGSGPGKVATGDVLIVAALPDPAAPTVATSWSPC